MRESHTLAFARRRRARLGALITLVAAVLQGIHAPTGAGAAPVTFAYAGPVVPIPDGAGADTAGPPVTAMIAVAGLGNSVTDVDFRIGGSACSTASGSTTVGIDHTFVGDIRISLTSPGGTTLVLIANAGSNGKNFCQVLHNDDAGAPSIQTAVAANAPFTGTWKPANPLSAFDGQNPNGNWTVTAQDFASGEIGSIRALSLVIDTATVSGPPSCDVLPAQGAIVGTAGNDDIVGTAGNDVIFGLGGNDRLSGLGGDDLLCGGDGIDSLLGGPGNDTLVGGAGTNWLQGGEGNDLLLGGPDIDRLDGGTGTNTNNGGAGFNQCVNPTTGPGCP